METRFVRSSDGARLAYDVSGSGPALILLHGGFVQGKQSWHEASYVERLSKEFSVITMDLRGHGESDKPVVVEAYGIQTLMDDVHAVAAASDANDFSVWGFSYGATIALHLAANSGRVKKAVIAGSMFGQIFPDGYIESIVSEMELMAAAQEEGRLDELSLTPDRQRFIAENNLRVVIASMSAMASWPLVEPRDLLLSPRAEKRSKRQASSFVYSTASIIPRNSARQRRCCPPFYRFFVLKSATSLDPPETALVYLARRPS
jgi:pimeloyl-ACP methyl ester carboxylesterase